jgi:hypothetical protein
MLRPMGIFWPRISKSCVNALSSRSASVSAAAGCSEPENGRKKPDRRRDQAEHDHAPRRAIRPRGIGQITAQEPCRHVGHADTDEIGEICRRNQPYRIAYDQEDDRNGGGQQRGRPWTVRCRTPCKKAGQQAVLAQLRQRARRAGQRLHLPWNMFNMMNQIAAALPKLPRSGANVGRARARGLCRAARDRARPATRPAGR